MKLIAGLGNPGPRYARTRHNAGFLVVDALAERRLTPFRKQRLAQVANLGGLRLLKPTTLMNLSGRAVQAFATRHSVRPNEIVVVHDDMNLPLGRLRIKLGGGGSGGQNGVQDIIDRIGPDFVRLKIGIGKPPGATGDTAWVLGRFLDDENAIVVEVVRVAADALEVLLTDGPVEAMNRVNGFDLTPSPRPDQPTAADSDDQTDSR